MCPLPSNWLRPESLESQLITEGCEYWKDGVAYCKLPSSVRECGKQLFLSADNVSSNSHRAEKTAKKGSALIMSEDVATEKLSHNAKERQRRKILNALYGKLRSLLPHSTTNMKKKFSKPAIVCGILKYIPQLQGEIQSLSRQRAQLLTLKRVSQQALKRAPTDHAPQMLRNKLDLDESPNGILTEVSILARGPELLVTVQTADAALLLFSRLLLLLEEERLDVMNASTFMSAETAWHSIQVKAMESSWRLDTSALRLKILRSCEQR